MAIDLKEKEKLLLIEYKIGMDAYYRSEAIYTNRENFFFAAMGFIVAAAANLLKDFNISCNISCNISGNILPIILVVLLSLLGIFLSDRWYNIHKKSTNLSYRRLNRLKQIENKIPKTSYQNHEKIFKFFTITASKDKQYMEASKLRSNIPKIFEIIWIIILIFCIIILIYWLRKEDFCGLLNSLISISW